MVEMVKLVRKLLQRTSEGRVPWEPTAEEGVYQAAFPAYAVQILSRRIEGRTEIVLHILDQNGVLVEELSDLDLSTTGGSRVQNCTVCTL